MKLMLITLKALFDGPEKWNKTSSVIEFAPKRYFTSYSVSITLLVI